VVDDCVTDTEGDTGWVGAGVWVIEGVGVGDGEGHVTHLLQDE
jgi:hypothetical protein